jgi:hypothetical protein
MRFALETGTYEGEVQVPSSAGPPVVSEGFVFVRPATSGLFAQGLALDPLFEEAVDRSSAVPFGTYDELPEVAYAENNYLLKQGPAIADEEGGVYTALRYAGLVMGFNSDGSLRFKTGEPIDVSLPEFSAEDVSIPGVTAVSPPVNLYPSLFIKLSSEGDRIYALCSCKKYGGNMSIDEINEGTRVYAYDKNTGELEMSFDLPLAVRDLEVTSDAIFAVAVRDDVELVKLTRPF